MVDVKRCPFCGGKAVIVAGERGIKVQCVECGNQTETLRDDPVFRVKGYNGRMAAEIVIDKWNRRGSE